MAAIISNISGQDMYTNLDYRVFDYLFCALRSKVRDICRTKTSHVLNNFPETQPVKILMKIADSEQRVLGILIFMRNRCCTGKTKMMFNKCLLIDPFTIPIGQRSGLCRFTFILNTL